MNYTELNEWAKELNVELHWNRDCSKITDIRFNFPYEVWGELCDTEGELLEACCGNISTIRDCFISALREHGEMRSQDVQKLVVNMAGHDWAEDHPVSRVKMAHDVVQPYLELRHWKETLDPTDAEDVAHAVADFADWYACECLFNKVDRGTDPLRHANQIIRFADFQAKIRLLFNLLKDHYVPPLDGFGLTSEGKLVKCRSGLLVCASLTDAREFLKYNQGCEIRKVRLSLENGVELGEILPSTEAETCVSPSSPSPDPIIVPQ